MNKPPFSDKAANPCALTSKTHCLRPPFAIEHSCPKNKTPNAMNNWPKNTTTLFIAYISEVVQHLGLSRQKKPTLLVTNVKKLSQMNIAPTAIRKGQ